MQSHLSVAHFHSEEAAYEYVEARLWPDGPVCPHCGATSEQVGRLRGKTNRIGLRKCYACHKPFTVKVGTVFESSHVPMRLWLQAIYLFCSSKKGISTRQLQRTFQCGLKTAWFLGHRVREAMTELGISNPGPLGGANQVVESDDVDRASYLMTDESPVYWSIGRQFAGHGAVNHSAAEYVRAYFWHTNTAENYFSILKRGIYGCYFHVSEAHLHRYTAEFDFRYNNRIALGINDITRADRALLGVKGK